MGITGFDNLHEDESKSIGELFKAVYVATEKAKNDGDEELTNIALNAMEALKESLLNRNIKFLQTFG